VSATTVGRGVVQVESGLQYTHESIGGSPAPRRFSVPLAGRGGGTDRLEFGLDGEPLGALRGAEGATNIRVPAPEAEVSVFDSPEGSAWPTLGLQPLMKLPVAREPIDSGKFAFGVLLLASFDLPAAFSLDFNAGVGARDQSSGGLLAQAQSALGLSHDVTRSV